MNGMAAQRWMKESDAANIVENKITQRCFKGSYSN
jgi:hypothetical protein